MRPWRVILSSNVNPKYLQFWPLVSYAWKKLFNMQPWLALVVDDYDEAEAYGMHPLMAHGNIVVYTAIKDIPECNQAKVARYFLASKWNDNSVVMTNDMDLLPLQTAYGDSLFKQRPAGHLMTIGSELYTGPEKGKFTAGYLTAESSVWRSLVNPSNLEWDGFIKSFVGMKKFDHKEDIARNVFHEDPDTFSDESLLRALLSINPVPMIRLPIGFWPYTLRALDRSNWQFDPKKLADGTYVEAHLLRPWSSYETQLQPLVDYIKNV